jgi:hypothetical protein
MVTRLCEAEIDPDTGAIELTRYASVDDVGRCINPLIVDRQTRGAIAQGTGEAAWERIFLDPSSGHRSRHPHDIGTGDHSPIAALLDRRYPQVATAIAGAAIGPAVNTMTLGIVKQAGFIRQNGIDQTFKHAGNLAGARSYASWRKEEPLARLTDFLCSAAGARDRRGSPYKRLHRRS